MTCLCRKHYTDIVEETITILGKPKMTTRTLVTAEEFFSLPDDNLRHDLIEGEVWDVSLAGREHGRLANRIAFVLTAYADAHQLGELSAAETGFTLARDPDTVLGPDVAFVQAARLPSEEEDRDGPWPIAPDLAVEIYSPGDRAGQITKKVQAYLDAGVRLVWVVYPEREQVVVHIPGQPPRTLGRDDALDGSPVLPGFSYPLRSLWAGG
jgi:Uma2 family endonuclease